MPLDQNYSSIRVESNFVRAGFKNSFSMGTKVVFFGVLRFLSSMRSVVSGMLRIETVFDVMFSNSLIIHQVKTKKIINVKEVWIPGLNYHRF